MLRKIGILLVCLYGYAAAMAQSPPSAYTRYIRPGEWVTLVATATNATLYQWYLNGQPITSATTKQYVVNQAGYYLVQAFNGGNCGSELSDPVQILLLSDSIPPVNTDLSIIKRADNTPVLVNQPFNYYLTIANNGPVTATGIMVTDTLPQQLALENIVLPETGTAVYNAARRIVEWRMEELPVRQQAQLTFTTRALRKGWVENAATVVAATPDSVPANNRSVHNKEIIGLHIPNVITPNGDGNNDRLIITGLDNYSDNEMIILNRWGNHVFEQRPYQQQWTGEGLTEGTYFYLLRIRDSAGRWQEFKGYVTLIRPK